MFDSNDLYVIERALRYYIENSEEFINTLTDNPFIGSGTIAHIKLQVSETREILARIKTERQQQWQ